MKKVVFVLIIMGMSGWAVYDFFSSSDSTSDETGISVGQVAPDFQLDTHEGESASLSDYRGQRVIVNFWATWCPPCRAEIPDFQKLYDNEDVEILAVNLTDTEESIEGVGAFVEEYEMTFPVFMDENGEVAGTYDVNAYPTSYMIDSDGYIEYIAKGAMNYDLMAQELEKME